MTTWLRVRNVLVPPALTTAELALMVEAFTTNQTPLPAIPDPSGFARLPPVNAEKLGYQSICPTITAGFLAMPPSPSGITQEIDGVWVIETTTILSLSTLYRRLKRCFPELQLSWSTIWAIHLHWPLSANDIRLFFAPGSPTDAIICENGAGNPPVSHLTVLHQDPARSKSAETEIICPAGYRFYLPAPPLVRERGGFFLDFFNLITARLSI